MTSKIEISHRTIIFTVAFLAGLWVVLQIRDILFLLFISFLFMTALNPLVWGLERIRIPRLIAILVVYAVVFGLFGVLFAGTVPALVTQSSRFTRELPNFIARVLPYWSIDASSISAQIAPIGENLVKVTVGIFSNVLTTLTVLAFTFYFLVERRHAQQLLTNLMGETVAGRAVDILRKVERRLGAWVRGELFLMFFIGLCSYIGLTILRVEFALPLAIIAGLLEIIPVIGPIMSAIPAVLVALSVSPFLALTVVALYFLIQQIENNILVPIVMRKVTGLSPLITILSLMIGGRLAGVTGAVLAVPVLLLIQIAVEEFVAK